MFKNVGRSSELGPEMTAVWAAWRGLPNLGTSVAPVPTHLSGCVSTLALGTQAGQSTLSDNNNNYSVAAYKSRKSHEIFQVRSVPYIILLVGFST